MPDGFIIKTERHLKKASWFLILFLGAIFYDACTHLPSPGDSSLNLSSHISIRYTQQSKAETGIQSPTGAVLGDYRAFDLLAAGSLLGVATLSLFLFFPAGSRLGTFFSTFLGLGGIALALRFGFF